MEIPRSPLPLSSKQRGIYEQRAFSIVQQNVTQCAHFLSSEGLVGQLKWKHLKSRGNIKIYRAREEEITSGLSKSSSPISSTWPPPSSSWQPQAELLCIGTIRGTLDDAMYGGFTPTQSSMAKRSLYIGDELVSHRVLCDIKLPTSAEPFRYLGLKWVARAPSLAAIIRPRDMMFLEASGITVMLTPDGHERVGYVAYDSVDIPELDPPTSSRMVRARVTSCYLFRQAGPNVVEIYATMLSNAGGNIPAKLAALSGAAVMISVSKVVDCAVKKKLLWIRTTRAGDDDASEASKKYRERQCRVCFRGLSHFSVVVQCKICYNWACSRCITARTVVVEKRDAELARTSTPMCKSCVATAMRTDNAAELATREYCQAHDGQSPLSSCESLSQVDHSPSMYSSAASYRETELSFGGDTPPLNQPYTIKDAPVLPEPSRGNLEEEVVEEISTSALQLAVDEKVDLWKQLSALQMQAEHTYNVVSQQSESLHRSDLE